MDAPDMLVRKDNIALIIEHFEFDSYRVTRKGSQNRREQSRIEGAEKKGFWQEASPVFLMRYMALRRIKITFKM